jgi:hypothetical protein
MSDTRLHFVQNPVFEIAALLGSPSEALLALIGMSLLTILLLAGLITDSS